MIDLRPYQQRAVAEVRAAFRRERRVLLVAPTGFGKTATASALIGWSVARGHRVLFLVHRREIVRDTHRRLVAAGVSCGLVMADEPSSDAPVQVCSIQTLAARGVRPPADLIVWDEAHHCAASTYRDVHAAYPRAWHLGLTATPERADGVGLRDAFDALVVGATIPELQAQQYLAEVDTFAPLHRSGTLARDPVDAWRELAGGRPAVFFCASVAESRELAARIGPRAAHLDGSTPTRERDEILRRYAAGDLDALCNVYVLTEGWDCSRAKVCVLARGCGSPGTYLQMVGRVLRRHGDERATLVDLMGAVREHGLPQDHREYTLDGIEPTSREARAALSQCLACGAVFHASSRGPVCRACSNPWPAPTPTRVQPAALERVLEATPEQRGAELERLVAFAHARGYKPGWAAHKYRAKYGRWPPRGAW